MFPTSTVHADSFKDELALAAGKVTPGVDDTPYIQYAIEALTRDRAGSSTTEMQDPSLNWERYNGRHQQQEFRPKAQTPLTESPPRRDSPSRNIHNTDRTHQYMAANDTSSHAIRLSSPHPPTLPPSGGHQRPLAADQWLPVDKTTLQTIDPRGRTYPPLTFKPRILRPFSMLMLMALCILMIAGLVFSAVYSQKHDGLTPYPGSIYSGQYFVFRILPQLLAGIILIYAQNIITASRRIIPFATLAREDPQERYLALFESLYPSSFLLPQLSNSWQLTTFGMATWLANFTIPIQSAAFTCIYVDQDGQWIWAATQGIIWTLVALYAILLVTTCILMTFWFGHWTGLTWDIRSVADLIPLLHRTNTMDSYRRKNLFQSSCGDNKDELRERWFDRLGYWQTEDMRTGGIWHTIGTSSLSRDGGEGLHGSVGSRRRSNDTSVDSHHTHSSALLGFEGGKYLPWCLRDVPLIAFVLVTSGLLLALIIVSFLPQTNLEAGFAPFVVARPDDSAFSAANFLYSFLPATLAMVLFLMFQSFDHALRTLQPWGDMSTLEGAVASKSILADYAACLPFQASWRALKNGHWRVAVISLMSVLFIALPVLAGGLFMALTTPTKEVRMFPSMSAFGVLLAFLVLYVGGLSLLIPFRKQFQLPHAVSTISSLISLCTAKDLCDDAAFRSIRSRKDLEARLGVGRDDSREESMWFFGVLAGRDESRMSVRRMKRLTEKVAMTRTRTMNSMV